MSEYPLSDEPEMTKDYFVLFREYILENGGLYLDDSKMDPLHFTLTARIAALGFKNYKQYYQYLKFHPDGEEEFKTLITYLTISETCFFRNAAHFQVLKRKILPSLIQSRNLANNRVIRIWCAGCSTGEEPYSLAILILELLPDLKDWQIEILGTDISEKALKIAAGGRYRQRALRLMSNYYKKKYFLHKAALFELDNQVKSLVKFRYFNLVKEPFPLIAMNQWDIIICCNVMIYFRADTIKRVVYNFYDCLNAGGYFFTGSAESLPSVPHRFQVIYMPDCFFYQKITKEEAAIAEKNTAWRQKSKEQIADSVLKSAAPEPIPCSQSPYDRAVELFIKENYDDALASIIKYVQENKTEVKGLLLLSQIYLEKANFSEAVFQSENILKIDPFNETAYYILGFAQKQSKNYSLAIDSFTKAIYLDRSFTLAHYHLALIYKDLGDAKASLREFKNALKILKTYSGDKPIDLSGKFTARLLLEICQKNINSILSTVKNKK